MPSKVSTKEILHVATINEMFFIVVYQTNHGIHQEKNQPELQLHQEHLPHLQWSNQEHQHPNRKYIL